MGKGGEGGRERKCVQGQVCGKGEEGGRRGTNEFKNKTTKPKKQNAKCKNQKSQCPLVNQNFLPPVRDYQFSGKGFQEGMGNGEEPEEKMCVCANTNKCKRVCVCVWQQNSVCVCRQ